MPFVVQLPATASIASASASAHLRRSFHLDLPLRGGQIEVVDNAVTMLPNLKWCGENVAFWGRGSIKYKWRGLEAAGVVLAFRSAQSPAQEHLVENLFTRSVDFSSGIGLRRFSSVSWGNVGFVPIGGVKHRGAFNADRGDSRIFLGVFDALQKKSKPGELWTVAGGRFSSASASHGTCHGWNLQFRASHQSSHGWRRIAELAGVREPLERKTSVSCRAASPLLETTNSEVMIIKKGTLLEFEREKGKFLLAVAQNRDGKSNWTAIDQHGAIHTVKPQQITYLVPSPEEFKASDIASFVEKVDELQDLGLLEYAWEEVLEEKVVHAGRLAQILYSKDNTAVECYTVHRMLSSSQVYFRCKQHNGVPVYEPRSLAQVKELQQKKLADEKAHELLQSYIKMIRMALECPQNCKPSESTWHEVEHFKIRTDALRAYALGSASPAQKKSAEEVIEALGMTKSNPVVVNLLIGMGIFSLHVNVDLLKLKNISFTKEQVAAVERLHHSPQPDPDMETRVDLTKLKVYTIDSSDTCEIDDGLSATRLPDGRIKVWIHIADPTRWLPHDHILSREAELRGTTIYLPTGTIPMFPMELAAGQLSLQQGRNCCAISLSVVLFKDGSIAEYSLMNSMICPTYKLSYDNVGELLLMHVPEEQELYLLAEAASLRIKWRLSQGACITYMPEADVKVTDPDLTEPSIILDVKDQSAPPVQLVSEMMILCGEAIALIGGENKLCLPYRGQAERMYPKHLISNIPEGPSRAFAMRRFLGSADMSFTKPIAHASLGLNGYVQFTSPIRRSADLIAHYQVKAHMRGDPPPFTSASVESKMVMSSLRTRDARKLQVSSIRYWTIEYLRRQPKDKQFEAVVLQHSKDNEVSLLILEVGLRSSLMLSSPPSIGTEVRVAVVTADPRKDILTLKLV